MLDLNHSIAIVCPKCDLETPHSILELLFTERVNCRQPCGQSIHVADQYERALKELTQRFGDSRNFWGVNDRLDAIGEREFQLAARQELIELGLS